MSNHDGTRHAEPAFSGLIGVGRRDITPPVGIYARSWGAATGDVATGIHRPLTATALALRSTDDTTPLVLVALDLGWWKSAADEWRVRRRILEALGLQEQRLLLSLSHTHAGPSLSLNDKDKPGGDAIGPYLDSLVVAVVSAAKEALATAEAATLTWTTGRCSLAQNRDLFDGTRHLCGFNPAGMADDTLLVGRVTSAKGRHLATVVNYACHPTTLAWENHLISPDYVGAMRELVECQTGQAPCLFLQGASGELAPREGYTGGTDLADKNGRALGYAVLGVLEWMLPADMQLEFRGAVESGAALAPWWHVPRQASRIVRAAGLEVDLEVREVPSLAEMQERWSDIGSNALTERLARRQRVRREMGDGPTTRAAVWLWRLGDALLVGQANEAYSLYQTELRRQFHDHAVVVMNVAGGCGPGYLPPSHLFDHDDIYPIWQTPYARGSLERVLEATRRGIHDYLLSEPGA
jgi:hypothetical protein